MIYVPSDADSLVPVALCRCGSCSAQIRVPKQPLALRLESQLLYGLVVVFQKRVTFLYSTFAPPPLHDSVGGRKPIGKISRDLNDGGVGGCGGAADASAVLVRLKTSFQAAGTSHLVSLPQGKKAARTEVHYLLTLGCCMVEGCC